MTIRLSPQGQDAVAAVEAGLVITPTRGKRPYRDQWQHLENTIRTVEQAVAHYLRQPSDGLGLVHEHSSTVSFDVDNPPVASELLRRQGLELGDVLAAGARILSRPGRAKAIFRMPGGAVPPRTVRLGGGSPALELRGAGGQDLLPRSRHPHGFSIGWDGAVELVNLPEIPPELLEVWLRLLGSDERRGGACGRTGSSRFDSEAPVDVPSLMINGAPEGSRNREILRALCALRREGATHDGLRRVGYHIARKCRPPLPYREVDAIMASIYRNGYSTPTEAA